MIIYEYVLLISVKFYHVLFPVYLNADFIFSLLTARFYLLEFVYWLFMYSVFTVLLLKTFSISFFSLSPLPFCLCFFSFHFFKQISICCDDLYLDMHIPDVLLSLVYVDECHIIDSIINYLILFSSYITVRSTGIRLVHH